MAGYALWFPYILQVKSIYLEPKWPWFLSFVHRRKEKSILPWKGIKPNDWRAMQMSYPFQMLCAWAPECSAMLPFSDPCFFFLLRLQLLFFKLWELEKCICERVHFGKKITESARAVHRGNYAETVNYAGWEGSGHILKARPKQNPSVSTSSPWQQHLIRPSLGRRCLCLQRAASASPSHTASCPSPFLSPSLHFGWDQEPRQREGIFAESSKLTWLWQGAARVHAQLHVFPVAKYLFNFPN